MLTAVIQRSQMARRRRMQQVAYEVVSALSIRIDGYQRRFCLKLARYLDPIMPYVRMATLAFVDVPLDHDTSQ